SVRRLSVRRLSVRRLLSPSDSARALRRALPSVPFAAVRRLPQELRSAPGFYRNCLSNLIRSMPTRASRAALEPASLTTCYGRRAARGASTRRQRLAPAPVRASADVSTQRRARRGTRPRWLEPGDLASPAAQTSSESPPLRSCSRETSRAEARELPRRAHAAGRAVSR